MLKRVQEGQLELAGVAIDLLLDATAMMRRLLEEARDAVTRGEAFAADPELGSLLARLEAAREQRLPEPELPEVEPGMKLGEILQRTAAVSREQIDSALAAQQSSGLRLGEELVASGVVEAKKVAHALRAQRQCEAAGQARLREMVKVDLEYLDSLVETIGELVIAESMLVNLPEVAAVRSPRARGHLAQLAKIARDLQSAGLRLRMVPVRGAFQKMARLVRDLSRKSGKRVRLIQSGEGTEMDRNLVERLADPLVHMIRNAVDHGIEPAEERQRRGKPSLGSIWLAAYLEGGSIVIEVRDDGRGLDREAILAKARSQGLVRVGEALSDAEVMELIFAPGFSTAAQVTEISGRGVGMDVVKSAIQAMRGRVLVSSTPGKGTTFRIVLPLTLAIIEGILVACGDERYVLPALAVRESLRPTAAMIASYAGREELLALRGELLPLVRLDRLLDVPRALPLDAAQGLVVVVETTARTVGLVVDDVIAQQQVVIKPVGEWLAESVSLVAGATILADGRVGLILDVEELGRAMEAAPARAEA
jgi:two-component system chemotaxis sensor kinase CheA